ncbi:uncharacterized protein MYCFIDRAFT_210177 [Pseudocercospora fijiensis CIRAD86]|uniref:Uncharacterized protein n=1 Tax=Pseudocercospora fijiensis (strain CIRAD86) TaxID=383855 RepID=N1QA09_PSEFD|nr:uncharacterized protein MYCFIDRAFT_210177 [Pseudocercospora fijiensis CIRAD86]EME89760.1 hypothetical protein MYCFIDRAFT_210177 [Pseudocercospora fijiensis CIRAD86]
MQYKFFASAALAAAAFAQVDGTAEQSSQAAELLSVVSVLQTALPSSLIQEALTNSAGVSSELASEFAAGQTPSWFTALPSDVQTYLVPAIVDATAVTSASGAPHPSANSTSGNTTSIILTTRVTSSSSSSSSETGASATGSSSDSSSSSSEAGAMPTAVLGAGLAGAVGIVGLLAL